MTMTTEDSPTTPPNSASGPVPDAGPEAAERLRLELLAFKDASGLSYAKIGERTHYAKSSWERWVNGKQFPPRGAVESLGTAFEHEVAPLLELWDLADRERSEREQVAAGAAATGAGAAGAEGTGAEDGAADAPAGRTTRWTARRAVAAGALAAVLVAALVLVLGLARDGDATDTAAGAAPTVAATGSAAAAPAPTGSASTTASAPATPRPIGCSAAGCSGKDPGAMGCSQDGQTLVLGKNQEIVMELRYSKACSAAWGRITYAAPNAIVSAENSDGTTSPYAVKWGNDAYSPMVELTGDKSAWVCATLPDGATRACTDHVKAPAAP
ncbi:hypothetical protein GCM10010495_17060 [Kitasatospora herbaricolor]|uniref:DUF2690 domain-containing protein n=1 Tax=Kitasatospora herbaricolor TaxID=68217 RepID=UPI001749F32C|nr:DUF2690 domain-containing protein [Kitasatospora herbaricolor]MDQ0308162.1 hypothetical protein [Kitasatospora herbaricolor]GGV05748.1 hypothetical protein GCM10010495_17060 [Kitasatospora herbaricolor]